MTSAARRRNGFTLIEVLIVISLLGLVMVVVAAAVTIVIRTQPATEARVDDARTSLGLTTYLPDDVNSTPTTGFDRPSTKAAADAQGTGCAQNTVDGWSLLKLTWTETIGSTATYTANYRLIPEGTGTRIVRYYCKNGGNESVINMTSRLPALPSSWTPGSLPFAVNLVGTDGVQLELTTESGQKLTLDARSNNPAKTLPASPPPPPPPPVPPGNQPPTANNANVTTVVNTPITIALSVSDPDVGDALTIVPTAPTVTAATPGWSASISGFNATVTPPAAAPAGEVATFTYQARDPYGQLSPAATVTVTLVAAPVNQIPVAGNVSGQTVVTGTPLLINLPTSDPDGDPLAITLGPVSGGLTATVNQTTRVLTVNSDGSNTSPPSFTYTVNDGRGGTATGTVTVTVSVCNVTSLTPASVSRTLENGTKRISSSVTYTVTYTGPCTSLVLEFDHDSDGIIVAGTERLSFGTSGTSVTIDGANTSPPGLKDWSIGAHAIVVKNGIGTPVLRTANLQTS